MSNQRVCVFAAPLLRRPTLFITRQPLEKKQQQHIVYILFSPQSAENVPLYSSNSVASVSVKLLAAFFCVGANLSLRKHLLLLALRRWGRFARRFPAAKSEEKRMFSQAKLTCKTGGLWAERGKCCISREAWDEGRRRNARGKARDILGGPGAVSRAGRKGVTKVFKYGKKSLCLKTFVAPFLPDRLTAPGPPRMSKGALIGSEAKRHFPGYQRFFLRAPGIFGVGRRPWPRAAKRCSRLPVVSIQVYSGEL